MLRDTRRSSKPEYRARYPDARPFSRREYRCQPGLHRPGCGGSTPPSCRVRVASIAAMQRSLKPQSTGSTVATHHFRIRGEIIIILRFERRVCRWESCRMHQFTGMWFNPNSRGSRLRIWQPWGCKSLHAHHFPATGLSGNSRPRRLKIAEPSGCKSRSDQPSLSRPNRRVVNREQQTGSTQDRTALGVQVSPRRPIWNVNRSSEPGLFAKRVRAFGQVVQVHGIPPFTRV